MRTLLLADESLTVQRVIALTFAKEPLQVVAVFDGRQALETMATRKPDIILADTSLPNLDGYDLAREVRNSPELRHTPVLLLAGAFELVDEARLKSSGANGVIEKPVEPTVVIRRVKELLGWKTDETPATSGRLVTSSGGPVDRKLPRATPPSVTSTRPEPSNWDELRSESGLEADTPSVEGQPAPPARSASYVDALDAAFDSLDDQIDGRAPIVPPRSTADIPRPEPSSPSASNPVFEVDADWFASEESETREQAVVERIEIVEDLNTIEFAAPPAAPAPVFEVDDKWFAEAERARADNRAAQDALAAEMGVNDLDLPEQPATSAVESPAIPEITSEAPPSAQPVVEFVPHTVPVVEEEVVAPVLETAAPDVEALPEPVADVHAPLAALTETAASDDTPVAATAGTLVAPPPQIAYVGGVADDFARLLAFEQGEPLPPLDVEPSSELLAPPAAVATVMTEEAIDSIAERVAARLNSSLGEQWRDVMAAAVRDTVRSVVSETSERLIREEIDRIKNNKA